MGIIGCLALASAAQAQLPTPTYGWNLGNTLEPPSGEGTWGPAATQSVIDAVADAGFNTIRLPVAWDSHANQSTFQIDPAWMARVKEVVDWCYARNLYVLVNSHWDNGWLDETLAHGYDATVDAKMQSYWTQIANAFAGYDNRLLFAGANEPPCENQSEVATLMTYYQTFVNAVRSTGGNNASRWLVLSGPSTNIQKTYDWVNTLPNDPTPGRLAIEVHYYTPYPFALMDQDADWGKMSYFWGQGYHHPTRTDRNATFDEEAGVDSQMQMMADKFVNNGIPVILGEYCAVKRTNQADLTGDDLKLHLASRTYFHKYVTDSANNHGLKPINWDIAGLMFDWQTGALVDQDNARALTDGAALPPPGGGGIIPNGVYKISARHSGKALEVAGLGTANGSNVQQWGYWWGESQRWVVRHLGNNEYSIIGAQSGKALDVSGWGSSNGSNVHTWTYGGAANQKWIISATSDGYYRLSPSHAPSLCLDVNGVSSSDGANVQIWSFGWGTNQQWIFEAP